MTKFVIAGGGLVGSLLSVMMRKKGCEVTILEKREDPRKEILDGGRSINLVLTSRGMNALKTVGLLEQALELSVPVTGRMMHSKERELTYQPYGRDSSECNYSISRVELNKFLLDAAEKWGVQLIFNAPVDSVDFDQKILTYQEGPSKETLLYDILFGADGAGSAIRKSMQVSSKDFRTQTEFLSSGYKELTMPLTRDAQPPMDTSVLHIWPRSTHMLMGLANLDGSFTMTLYMPHKSSSDSLGFDALDSTEKVHSFFKNEFPDALELMPNVIEEFKKNPVGPLGTVHSEPWVYGNSAGLIGDAAHAIVPFFGQGMNCGFEDCFYLNGFLEEYKGDWHKALSSYDQFQRPNADAIAAMALENFEEMRAKVADPKFLLMKKVEAKLEENFPQLYRSRYGLVAYTLVPYVVCQSIGLVQKEILKELTGSIDDPEQLDYVKAKNLIDLKLRPLYEKYKVRN